ncbi:hypothetical protein MC885_003258 [Smutsia gigantea]|nr:hypothetical protein MC885_003258 [Smutsia gigantea]
MTLLLVLFAGILVQGVISKSLVNTTILQTALSSGSSVSLVSNTTKAPNLKSAISALIITRVTEKSNSTGHQISPPAPTPYTANDVSSPGTSIAASSGQSVPGPANSQEISTKQSSVLELFNATSNPAISVMNSQPMTSGIMATSSLETSKGTSGPSVPMATSSLETSMGTSGPSVPMATSSLETSMGTSGPSVPMATSSLETSMGTSGPSVPIETSSLETSMGTSGPSVPMATSPLETSMGTSGPSVPMATSSLETSKGISDSPSWGVKIPTMTTPKSSPNSDYGTNGTLLVALLVALLVFIVLMALILLWRQRQKRRTGILMLSSGGKRNGIVDAWAGPARARDEEALTVTAGGSGGNKGSGASEGEASRQRPTLTTFFSRRKSHQGSLALEELKAGSAPNLKGEEEPLVGDEDGPVEPPDPDGSVEFPTPDEPAVGDVEAPQCL